MQQNRLHERVQDLLDAVGKYALKMGEGWRLNHPEIMDSYQAVQELITKD